MIEELQSLYDDSGIWGQLILAAELGLIIVGLIMLYTVKQAIRFFMFLLAALIPVLLGLFGYLEFSAELSDVVHEGLDAEMLEQMEPHKPIVLGAIGTIVPLVLGFVGFRKVRRTTAPPTP